MALPLSGGSELHSSGEGAELIQLQGWALVGMLLEPAQVVCTYPLRSPPLEFLALFGSLDLFFSVLPMYLLWAHSPPGKLVLVVVEMPLGSSG